MSTARHTSRQTLFFRERNTAVFATRLAEPLVRRLGVDTLRIADVGTSIGKATWGVAAALAVQACDFRIDGFDADPFTIPLTAGPYSDSLQSLREYLAGDRNPGFPLACVDHFVTVGDDQVSPSQDLRARVRFGQRDLNATSLPEAQYGAGILTNVAYYYHGNDRTQLINNVLHGVMPGGLFMPEMPGIPEKPQYNEWYRALPDNFPLEPVAIAGAVQPGIFRKIG